MGSAEFDLVCLALRRPLTADDRSTLARIIAAGPDWRIVTEGARRHRVETLLLAGLQAGGQAPTAALGELRRLAVAAARRVLLHARLLGELSEVFAAAGVRMLALKGVALSSQLYGELARRSPRDIDILIEPDKFAEAAALLTACGYYRRTLPLSPRQEKAHRHWTKDVELLHPGTGVAVELHHRLCDNRALLDWDFDTLWRDRAAVFIGAPVATLSLRRLPLYLCAHGASHGWERLCWLVDFAAALQVAGAGAALADAERIGLATPMRHALLLAYRRLGLPVSETCLAEARSDRRAARLAAIERAFDRTSPWHRAAPPGSRAARLRYSWWQRLYRLALKPGLSYLLRQLGRECLSPADWGTIRLPDRLFWLYPAIRPVGWLMRRHRPPRQA